LITLPEYLKFDFGTDFGGVGNILLKTNDFTFKEGFVKHSKLQASTKGQLTLIKMANGKFYFNESYQKLFPKSNFHMK
jgi:hypothetical protein